MAPSTRLVPHLSFNSQAGFILFFFLKYFKKENQNRKRHYFPFPLSPGNGGWNNWNNSREVYTAEDKESCWWRRRTWTTKNIYFFHIFLPSKTASMTIKQNQKVSFCFLNLLSAVVRQANTMWSNIILQQTLIEDPLWQINRNRKNTRSDLFRDNCSIFR